MLFGHINFVVDVLVSDSLSAHALESWFIHCLPFYLAFAIFIVYTVWVHHNISKIPESDCILFVLHETVNSSS